MQLPKLNRSWAVLLAALVFGGLAAFSVSRYVTQTVQAEKARLRPNEEMVDVLVAKSDLKRGSVVSNATVSVRQIPKAYASGMAVPPSQFNTVEGSRTITDLRGGEMVLRNGLDGADATTFANKVQPGSRALTISVDDVNAIAGLLQPGDRIDLYFSQRGAELPTRPGAPKIEGTRLFLQNVQVLATGKQIRAQAIEAQAQSQTSIRSFATMTISVSPEDALRLISAQKAGTLAAVLRNPEDKHAAAASTTAAVPLRRPAFAIAKPVAPKSDSFPDQTEFYVGGRGTAISKQAVPVGVPAAPNLPNMPNFSSPTAPPSNPAVGDVPAASQMEALKNFFDNLRTMQEPNKTPSATKP